MSQNHYFTSLKKLVSATDLINLCRVRILRLPVLLTFAMGVFGGSLKAAEASATWLTVNAPAFDLADKWSTKSHAEFRFPDMDYLSYARISQKFYYKIDDTWNLGTHPTLERSRSSTQGDWSNTYRFDLELNPNKIKLEALGATLALRNRWELRWKEGKGSEIFHRVRQSTKLTWKFDHSLIGSYSIANEAFYEVDKDRLTMNRFYPITLGLNLSDSFKSSVYLMYQTKRSGTSSNWSGTYVSGLSLSF